MNFEDAAKLPFAEKIKLIGTKITEGKLGKVGVTVPDEPGEPERYIKAIKDDFPEVQLLSVRNGPIEGLVTIIFGHRDTIPKMGRELNSGNDALTELRPFWDKILVAIMAKSGMKEITLDMPDLQALWADGPPIVIVLGRRHINPVTGGFTLVVCKTQEEAAAIVNRHKHLGL